MADPLDRIALDRFTPGVWIATAALLLTVLYAVLQVGSGPHALRSSVPLSIARPPDVSTSTAPSNALGAWREAYWQARPAEGPRTTAATARHVGTIVQIVVFTAAALVLLLLRSNDLTAQLAVLALALSGIAGGGPLYGVERVLPAGTGAALTVLSWMAGPLAFPVIALAIFYFPSPSPLLGRFPWLNVVPFAAAAPMLLTSAATGVYLTGIDRLAPAAAWDASHPAVYFGSFAVALAINLAAIGEGLYRFRFNHNANERRRIRFAVITAVPGVLAYAIKDGTPIAASLLGRSAPEFAWPLTVALQGLVLLPAFGLTYAVGVARVLGPRVVLRRSIQYALAKRSLTTLAILPGLALVVSLVRNSGKTVAEVVTGGSGVFIVLLAASIAALRYRDRAQQWLDQRFFREEYDARKILVSLASRVRFETDPADLSSMVVQQIEEALHPERTSMLVSGVEEGRLSSIASAHGDVDSLALDGGLVTMLRWSDEPLEIFLDDPRSPARRLPPGEIEWLRRTGASLLVPVLGDERALVAILVLGCKRSEEAYSDEDRQLLASIAAQVGLGLDVARLRRRRSDMIAAETEKITQPVLPVMRECPRCGRCEDAGAASCPADGTAMKDGPMPRVLDNKYRIEQVLGRGGMGAVYRARDMRLDRLVAVKVVRAELLADMEARRRFRREAQIVARLQHPAIVSVFDYGTFPDGGAYLVMELVRGEDLRRVLHREGRFDPERAVRILSAVCSAIEAAHAEGVLHRDLKPENILLPGGGVEAKVLDFGVAKLLADAPNPPGEPDATALTLAGTIVGTPAYMAPEQLRADTPDARTDVFALGVIAYEMLAGELPFGRGSLADVILAQDRGAAPLAGKNPAVSIGLERAVRSALEPDPALRPRSPAAFAAELAQAAGAAT